MANKKTRYYSNEYKLKKLSAITIETWYRAIICGRNQRESYKKLKHASVVIQARFRANRMRDKEYDEFRKQLCQFKSIVEDCNKGNGTKT